ncbi:MAG: glycosyltransferase family 2 protein [bacterium]|nr:glycosyltransferase family 2 protein [bacterium]
MAAPRITIGLPTRNRAKSLDQTIRCICEQSFRELELRVSDNASTDETAQVIRSWTAADPRIRATRHEANVGPAVNFDGLRENVESEYFMWLADDDEIDANYLETCIAFLDDHPGHTLAAGVATLDNVAGNREGTVVPGKPMTLEEDLPAARVQRFYEEVGDNSTFYGVMRREALDRVIVRNTLGADWLLVAALAAQGRVRTLESTGMRRPHRWGPSSFQEILATLELPERWAKLPGWIIARDTFRDIAWNSPCFDVIARTDRLLLAARCARAVCRRFRISPRDVLRFYLSNAAAGRP